MRLEGEKEVIIWGDAGGRGGGRDIKTKAELIRLSKPLEDDDNTFEYD